MKKRFLALGLAAGAMVLMTACGDETTNTDILKADSFASDSLPTCDASYAGMLANDTSKNALFACTKVGATYEWVNVIKNIQAAEDNSGCTTKALEDKSGVNIVCMGKTIATLKNGENGEEGKPGTKGKEGDKGPAGEDATDYSDGRDLKLDSTDCKIVDAGVNAFVFYKCGNDTYAEDMDGFQADIKTWNGLNTEEQLFDRADNIIANLGVAYQEATDPTKSEGSLKSSAGLSQDLTNPLLMPTLLSVNFAISGTATLTVQEDSLTSTGDMNMEPFIGFVAKFGSATNLLGWGGVCLTYKSDSPMELVIANDAGNNLRATLKASAKETTVDLLPEAFELDYLTPAGTVKLKDVMSNASFLAVKVVGGIEKGTYTNDFAISEIGAYGRCGGPTYTKIHEAVLKNKGKTGTVSDKKDNVTYKYKTITIGNQVWMAENLSSPYVVKDGDNNDVFLSYCPDDKDELAAKGCLYTWSAAMDSAGKYLKDTEVANECGYNKTCAVTKPVRGICPDGWHLPSQAEKDTLLKYAGYNKDYPNTTFIVGRALAGNAEDGLNWLGFSATTIGWRTTDFSAFENTNYFSLWTTMENSGTMALSITLFQDEYLAWNTYTGLSASKQKGLSIRCIQDEK